MNQITVRLEPEVMVLLRRGAGPRPLAGQVRRILNSDPEWSLRPLTLSRRSPKVSLTILVEDAHLERLEGFAARRGLTVPSVLQRVLTHALHKRKDERNGTTAG